MSIKSMSVYGRRLSVRMEIERINKYKSHAASQRLTLTDWIKQVLDNEINNNPDTLENRIKKLEEKVS